MINSSINNQLLEPDAGCSFGSFPELVAIILTYLVVSFLVHKKDSLNFPMRIGETSFSDLKIELKFFPSVDTN